MRNFKKLVIFTLLIATAACQKNIFQPSTVAPATLRDVPALRLNFRYEADVPAPSDPSKDAPVEEKNAAVQADFDANRQQEILVRTIISPNKQRFLTVYQRLGDADSDYRLDVYIADGKFLRHVSPEKAVRQGEPRGRIPAPPLSAGTSLRFEPATSDSHCGDRRAARGGIPLHEARFRVRTPPPGRGHRH